VSSTRKVRRTWKGTPTYEGAGVLLKRVFANSEASTMDPFLLLDHFGSDNPDDYLAGFPWHPHRGIETVTYMIDGEVEHGDSLSNHGVIGSGDIQWMTAGSGIIHQEMPQPFHGTMRGFQLWVNLPARDKMMRPRYRDISGERIPEIVQDGIGIKVIAGEIGGVKGIVEDVVVDIQYLDIALPPDSSIELPLPDGHTAFAYVMEGEGYFDQTRSVAVDRFNFVLFDRGSGVFLATREGPLRLILVSGMPLGEPIAWRGPIVMNTEKELDLAFREYREGNFIKQNAN
jgi:quercetin 2,3-dioxygenase